MQLMTFLPFFFWSTSLACFAAAFCYGEYDEKRGVTIMVCGSAISAFMATAVKYFGLDITPWLLLVDLFLLVAFTWLMFDSQKYWPVWVGSLQLISVVIHFLDILVTKTLPLAFEILQGFWAYPMYCAIMAGVYGSHVAMRRNQEQ
jgi:hypothetical protein